MKFKTLVKSKGTDYQEFYGYMATIGWVTSASPINMMHESITWKELNYEFPDLISADEIDLVTIEIKIIG